MIVSNSNNFLVKSCDKVMYIPLGEKSKLKNSYANLLPYEINFIWLSVTCGRVFSFIALQSRMV